MGISELFSSIIKNMNDYIFLWAIAGVLFVGAMSPGPSFFIVAQNSLSKSRAHGVATALGTGLGVSLFAILASFGVTALLENVPSAYVAFKLLGGAYLLYLAYKIWHGASQPLEMAENDGIASSKYSSGQRGSLFKAFLTGLITQTSNPKTALVIAGIFAAFVPAEPPANTAVLVALIAFVIDFCWYAFVAISLSTKATRQVYKKAKIGFDRTASIFLGVVGIKLLVS